MPQPLIIAHRGASDGEVDNSLSAFAKAIDVGADMIEFDVRRTRDDQLICFHDAFVDGRMINTLTRQELAAAAGHEPPLLDEVLDLAKNRIDDEITVGELRLGARVSFVRKTLEEIMLFISERLESLSTVKGLIGLPRERCTGLLPARVGKQQARRVEVAPSSARNATLTVCRHWSALASVGILDRICAVAHPQGGPPPLLLLVNRHSCLPCSSRW